MHRLTSSGTFMMTWSPSQHRLLLRVILVVGLITTNLTSSTCNIPATACPHAFANDTRDAFGLFNNSAYVQLGLTHRIPCLAYSYRENDTSLMVVWHKLNKGPNISEDIETQWLITYNNGTYTDSDRYSLTSNYSLLIKGVEESDGGKYRCEVKWFNSRYTDSKKALIDIEVIGHTFPHGSEAVSEGSSPSHLERGRRHTLPCGCASQTPDTQDSVVYWSMGEGITTDTQIIGARFSDGATLQIQHGADYSIGINASLTVNSLNDLQDTQRFWCHVFRTDGAPHSCSTVVFILQGHTFPHGSEAVSEESPTSSLDMLEQGRRHTLPCGCASQTPDAPPAVYWSTGEGVTTDTQIIGARFSDGASLQIQHGADYSIGSDASLTVNSLNDLQDTQRFLCHVFRTDGAPHSCSTVVFIQDGNPNIVLKASPTEFYLPEGFLQVLPCRSWTPGDVMCGVQWFHESSQRVVLSYNLSADTVEADPDYDLASDFGLCIKSVNHTHAGRYTCYILDGLRKAPLRGAIDTHVIGHTFPPGSGVISEASTPTSIERGRRHMLPCECASQTNDAPPAVYWSMGEGITTDTQIIGARFSDGATLQIQHGADYSIGIVASLTINSLNDVQDTQRFWCHLFQSNGTLHSCSTDVQIQDRNPNIVLKTSPTEFYLPEGYQQVLPCRSWKPGDRMRKVQWIREPSRRIILSYNLFADSVIADLDYDLASNFGLLIKSVNHTHAGRYTCYIFYGPGKVPLKEALDTHVIGDSFPASPYNMSSSITVMQGQGMTLPCECAQQSPNASILAVYWSKGEGNSSDTDVIAGRLANGSVLNSRSNGHNISSNWSLTVSPLRNSSFSCHVFRSDGTLANCRTNVWIMQEAVESYLWLLALVIVIVVVPLCLWYKRERSSTSSCQMGEWPETDQRTYTPPELFHNTPQGRPRLNEKQHLDFFIDSSNEKCHVLLQGKSGSGKTTFLYKLRHELQNLNARYFLFWPRTVVLTKALHVRQAVRNIKLHISYFLHLSNAVILVDDCNGVNDIEEVLEATTDLSRCQLVMTTRSEKLAHDMSQERGWHHVTITGFSERNAREYVKSKLEADCKYNYQPETEHVKYLDLHILFESVACLPGFLNRLCEFRGLELHNSVSDVVTGIVKSMFCKLGPKSSLANHGNADRPTEKQHDFLIKCGEIALPGMFGHPGNVGEVTCGDANIVLRNGIEIGLLCDEKDSNLDSSKKREPILQGSNMEEVSSRGSVHYSHHQDFVTLNMLEEESIQHDSSIQNSIREGSGPQASNIEITPGPQASNIENSNGEESILQTSSTENSTGEVSRPQTSNIENSPGVSSDPEMFNNETGESSGPQVSNIENLTREGSGPQASCIDSNKSCPLLSGHAGDASQVKFALEITRDFSAGKKIAQDAQKWIKKIDIGNINELANALVFASAENFNAAFAIVNRLITVSKNNHKPISTCTLNDEIKLQKVMEVCLEAIFNGRWEENFNSEMKSLFHEGQLRFIGISSHMLRLMAYCLKYMQCSEKNSTCILNSVVLFCIDQHLSSDEFTQYVGYLCPGQKDQSVLHDLQQELTDTHSSKCHSSISGTEFVRYLSEHKHLEKIVLLGPVLDTQQTRDFIHSLCKLKQLKHLDLRLNTQMADRGFTKTMKRLSACEALTDLRLSLYKVTSKGFTYVKDNMEKVAPMLKRLQTLYLLHGSLTEDFGGFLTDLIGYMDNLQCFHVSALVASDEEQGIPNSVVETIKRSKPTLQELFVDNKDALMAQLEEA